MAVSNPKDWTEDAAHENGNYKNICLICKELFTGHKRRMICKECLHEHAPSYE